MTKYVLFIITNQHTKRRKRDAYFTKTYKCIYEYVYHILLSQRFDTKQGAFSNEFLRTYIICIINGCNISVRSVNELKFNCQHTKQSKLTSRMTTHWRSWLKDETLSLHSPARNENHNNKKLLVLLKEYR